jgi:hypothetical protein
MSELVERLQAAGKQHQGTDLGGLLQWAALHIESQDEAIAEVREEHASEEQERICLEQALHASKLHLEQALRSLQAAWWTASDT